MGKIDIPKGKLEEIYYKMLLTRLFEKKLEYFFSAGMLHGTTHLYIGEEATAIGVCCALDKDDQITSTHRGHGHCIGKGADVKLMMAEMFGKQTGYCKGKGGSMHIADLEIGNLGGNGIVGGGIPIAVGAALTTQYKELDRVVVCFFGDGATNQGSFHESLNLASIWKLPVIFICENNLYGMSIPIENHMNIKDIAQRAKSYGIPGKIVDGNNVFEVYNTVLEAKSYVKQNGPILIESKTYRISGHSKSDANVYRTKEEIEQWKKKDPIKFMKKKLLEQKIFTQEQLETIEKQAAQEIEVSVEFANNSPYPPLDAITDDVYA
ncbi:MAG: thiamine pyrophosphate-dependent dehydrogenase E1 component subunit alpha [Clostridia bacterium]|nr:thiamine pyrophosphate-dependent dehydrogenase E1 component subunit alpha [Clostridia bacterium]